MRVEWFVPTNTQSFSFMNKSRVNGVVLPGDVVGKVEAEQAIRVGIGLVQNKENICAIKAGVLRYESNFDFYWVENDQKRVISSSPFTITALRSLIRCAVLPFGRRPCDWYCKGEECRGIQSRHWFKFSCTP